MIVDARLNAFLSRTVLGQDLSANLIIDEGILCWQGATSYDIRDFFIGVFLSELWAIPPNEHLTVQLAQEACNLDA